MSLTSIVLPVHNQAGHIEGVVNGYLEALNPLPDDYETVSYTHLTLPTTPYV